MPLAKGMPAAKLSQWHTLVSWDKHDSWMSGGPHLEAGIPYANIVWEEAGLRHRKSKPDDVAPWAREMRTHAQLAEKFGILFVTDDIRSAERYGTAYEVDLDNPNIVDVIQDPHVRTHNGWILVVRTGSQIALTKVPS